MSWNRIVKISLLFLSLLTVTSCESTEMGIWGFVWGALGYFLIGFLSYKCITGQFSWIESHPYETNSVVKYFYMGGEKLGLWFENKFPFMNKPISYGRPWYVALAITSITAIVFLFIGVYAAGQFVFYIIGLAFLISSLFILSFTYFQEDDNSKKKKKASYSLKVGTFVSLLLFLFIFNATIIFVALIMMAFAVASSNDSNGKSVQSYNPSKKAANKKEKANPEPKGNVYTVNYRKPSGSGMEEHFQYLNFDHEPSIQDVQNKLKEMGWVSDPNEVDVYSIRFGHGLPHASKNSNLLDK